MSSQYILFRNPYNTQSKFCIQLAPEDFSLEDVQHLQRSIRELHVENIQKTLAYVNLEQAYHCLEGCLILKIV